MTLSELTSDLDKLEKMTDAELEAYFAPVLHVTRIEQAVKLPTSKPSHIGKPKPDLTKAREIARQLGIQLDI